MLEQPLEGRSAFQMTRAYDAYGLPSLALDPFPPAGILSGPHDFALQPSRDDALPAAPLGPRPMSPTSIDKVASMMRSLSFTAASPNADAEDHNRREWAKVSRALMRDVRGDAVARLRERQPAIGARVESVLAFACGAMLGVEVPDGALAAIGEELGQLRHTLTAGVFPGAYYEEIFESDVAQLSSVCAARRDKVSRRLAAERDVWMALAAPVPSTAELDGVAAQADAAGLVTPGLAARAVSAMCVRAGVRESALQAAEAQVAQLRAELAAATRRLKEAEQQLTAAANTRVALERSVKEARETAAAEGGARKAADAEVQRVAQEMQEESNRRWKAERELQAEAAARNELQVAIARSEEVQAELMEQLAEDKATFDQALADERGARADAERAKTHAEARAETIELARARTEADLVAMRKSHQAMAVTLEETHKTLASEKDLRREAEQRAFREGDAKLRAHERITELDGALAAERGRLSVANDALLKRALEFNAADEALGATLRAREAEQRRIDELEARLDEEAERARSLASGQAEAVKAADASAVALRARLYALQAQLSESVRAKEDAAAAQARAEAQLGAALGAPRGPAAADGADGGGRLVAQLSEQLKAEAARRLELERISLGLQADLAAVNALALQRAGEAAVGGAEWRAPQPPPFDSAESAPRPPPALAARRATAAAGAAAPAGKAGNARRVVAEPADPRALALTRPSYSVNSSAVAIPAARALAADADDDELWSYADGAVARGAGGGAAGALGSTRPAAAGGAGAQQPGLPRLGSPFATAARGGLGKGYN